MSKAATISGILFDKDGTLLDYARSWVPVNYELARIAAGDDAALARRLLLAGGMDPDTGHVLPDSAPFTVDALTTHFDGLFASSADRAVAVTDLAAFFAAMHARGYWLGVASSDNEASIRATARRFGFDGYLHYVAGYDSGFGTKPEPGMVLGFCAATGLQPHEIAVVGDNNHDLHMGRSAGAGLTIAVLTGTGSRLSLSEASDYCLNDITELLPLLPAAATARPAA